MGGWGRIFTKQKAEKERKNNIEHDENIESH